MIKTESKLAVGMLTNGPIGVAHILSISWDDVAMLDANWFLLNLCCHWRLTANYDQAMLQLEGWGDPIPVTVPTLWMGWDAQTVAIPTYAGTWELSNVDGLRFFMKGAKQHGYFVLVAALDENPCTWQRPIVAFLRQ